MGVKALWKKAKTWFDGGQDYELPVREVTPAITPAPPDAVVIDSIPEPLLKVKKVIEKIKKPLAKRKK
jgi:hypothetical protein